MNILLDECTPRVVKGRLPGHTVHTVQEMGWAGLKNGKLLAAADRHFDLFITTDKNLRFQQNLKKYSFAVLLLPSNQVPVVVSLIHDIETALTNIKSGDFVELSLP
ncbi:MAG: hypothetical protein QOH49_2200 [Acidobacteriota bacterium]|jgi:hypothetical protein|nr:hypothetical protein [Acidobacteriota bacterium]